MENIDERTFDPENSSPQMERRNRQFRDGGILRIISWNINGIKARFDAVRRLIEEYAPDVVCLQKFRCQTEHEQFNVPGYKLTVSPKVSAGVATYFKEDITAITSTEYAGFSFPGHLLVTEIPDHNLAIANAYAPLANGNLRGADEERRLFDMTLYRIAEITPASLVICGDLNVVNTELDTLDGNHIKPLPCYRDWEHRGFQRILREGEMIDSFRILHPTERKFTFFWHNDPGLRAANRGDRIDYALISEWMKPNLLISDILTDVTDSPSTPLLLEIDLSKPIAFNPLKRYLIY